MAAAKQCDNCGALYTYNPNAKYNAIKYGKIDSCTNWRPGEHLDLCPGCLNAVISALKKSKNIANELRKENNNAED